MTTKKTTESQEFMYLSMGDIAVEEQIRSKIDMQSESFKALMESIRDRGILEPVLVTPKDGKYLLLCGERRYLAAQKLMIETIPARVIDAVNQKDEILAFQLTENLHREDLNPLDQAKGILAYILAKHPGLSASAGSETGIVYNLDGVMTDLVVYLRRPEDLPQEIRATVAQIFEISGKSIRTLYNGLSLLKLAPPVQEAILEEKLPLSQGYLFAANRGSPDFFTIFDEIMKTPVTNAVLEKMLTAYKRRRPKSTGPKPIPIKNQVSNLRSIKSRFETRTGMYVKSELQTYLDELQALTSFIKDQIEIAPETLPEKKPPTGPRPQV
jgi:ParB-like chromosome segregation protein Spo0J